MHPSFAMPNPSLHPTCYSGLRPLRTRVSSYVRHHVRRSSLLSSLPRLLWVLVATYFAASLAHFAHNAEYIAFYPNMPAWLTREQVYLAWLAVTGIGVLSLLLLRLGLHAVGVALVGLYGAFGLDGLAHYTLALCSEHTLATNITIWSEAMSGLALLLVSAVLLCRRVLATAASV